MPNSIAQIEVFNDGVFALDDHAHRSGYKSAACKVRERLPANVALTFMPINPTWREADISISPRDVRFTPESGHVQCTSACLRCAISGHLKCNNPCLLKSCQLRSCRDAPLW